MERDTSAAQNGRAAAWSILAGSASGVPSVLLARGPDSNAAAAAACVAFLFLLAIISFLVPWRRFPPRATLVLTPPAYLVASAFCAFMGFDIAIYGFVLIICFAGMSAVHGQWISLAFSPLLAVCALLPILITGATDKIATMLVFVMPLSLLLAETVGWMSSRWRAANQAALRSEARLQALVQQGTDVIMVVDQRGIIQFISPSIERVAGYLPQDMLGTPALNLIAPVERERAKGLFRTKVSAPGESRPVQLRMTGGDGREFWAEVAANNLLANRAVNGIVLTWRDVTEQRAYQQHLTDLAYRDELTGLANRGRLTEWLAAALARAAEDNNTVALVFLDLDRFKVINDSLGHKAGDALLVAVAARIADAAGDDAKVARLGGDEFTILLDNAGWPSEVKALAQRVLDALAEPFTVETFTAVVSASAGIALSPAGAISSVDLLRQADTAMYHAKERGRSRVVVFDLAMEQQARSRMMIEDGLRHALGRDELFLVYQPLFALRTGTIVEVEALLRWRHPQRGVLTPGEFLPVAEETGLMLDIGRWVLHAACAQAAKWNQARPGQQPLSVAVNLSSNQFISATLVDDVAAALAASALDSSCLTLEITEMVLMDEPAEAARTLWQLKTLGVRLAIDDFGTGFSSLARVRDYPIDVLKIDRAFVDGVETNSRQAALFEAFVRLGRTLDLRTVAEGIERPEQLDVLRSMGCDVGQGYLLAPPCEASDLSTILAALDQSAEAA